MALFEISLFSNALRRRVPLTAIIPVEKPDFPGVPQIDRSTPFRSLYLLHGFTECHTEWVRGTRIELYAKRHNIVVFMPSG